MRLDPNSAFSYGVLGGSYFGLNRFAEAKAVREKQVALKLDSVNDHRDLYVLAFLEGDTSGMQQEADWAKGKTNEFEMLEAVAEAAAFSGKLQKAREMYAQAIDSARGGEVEESAVGITARQVATEGQFGNETHGGGV